VRARLLIVEDEGIVALNIQRRLEGLGYNVVANVASGEEVIAVVEETRPELVLMDIKLEGKVDGIEAAAQIRDRFQIPVVYLTAYTNEETLNRAKLTEPYGYILKPFEARDLATTIEVALYKYQMEQGERRVAGNNPKKYWRCGDYNRLSRLNHVYESCCRGADLLEFGRGDG
jgi:CheY-like chemotaxis protein